MPAGSGAIDANGVYQYGEADAEALFSDLLNRGMDSVSDQFVADRTRLATLESIRPGTRKIKPTSVVVNAGVASIDTAGTVRLSGAVNKVSLNGLFNGSFENYKLTMRIKASAASLPAVQMRAAGVDAVAANYAYQGFGMSGVTAAGGAVSATTQWAGTNTSGIDLVLTMHMFGPALAAATLMESDYYTLNGATRTVGRMGADHSLATAYDGLSISLSGGATMVGFISCEGLN